VGVRLSTPVTQSSAGFGSCDLKSGMEGAAGWRQCAPTLRASVCDVGCALDVLLFMCLYTGMYLL